MSAGVEVPVESCSADDAYSITGWPRVGACDCGARSAILASTYDSASYECRGTPTDPRSAYGDDRCGRVYDRKRSE